MAKGGRRRRDRTREGETVWVVILEVVEFLMGCFEIEISM